MDKPNKKQFHQIGYFIRMVRMNDGLTQESAAKMIGISTGCLQNVETGKNTSLLTLYMIADTFGLHMVDFFEDLKY